MVSLLGTFEKFRNPTVLMNKRKKLKEEEKAKDFDNPVKNVILNGYSKMGYGPKKTEC